MKITFYFLVTRNIPNANCGTWELCNCLVSSSCFKCELLITIKVKIMILKSFGIKIVSQGDFRNEEINCSEL